MKKFIFIMAAVLAGAISASAQDSFKPEAGDFSLELNYTPGILSGNNSSAGFKLPEYGVKGRLFVGDRFAVKLNLGFSTNSTNDKTYITNPDNSVTTTEDISGRTSFSIMPGIEYHFGNYKRVSPYVGAAVGINVGNRVSRDVTGNVSSKTVSPTFGFAVQAAAGVDVYICKGLYAGLEMGLGYGLDKTGRGKTSSVDNTGATTESQGNSDSITSSFGFFATPSIRVGWFF